MATFRPSTVTVALDTESAARLVPNSVSTSDRNASRVEPDTPVEPPSSTVDMIRVELPLTARRAVARTFPPLSRPR